MGLFFQIQSSLILIIMLLGLKWRRDRKKHVPTMAVVISWDVLLILQIELRRHAIFKATEAVLNLDRTPLLIHLFFALTTVVIYLCLIFTGRKVLKGEEVKKIRPYHKTLGMTAVVFRLLTFATSFFV